MIRLVEPTAFHRERAIGFINEFINYNSEIYGSGGLDRYINDYAAWLTHLEEARNRPVSEDSVPSYTYFLMDDEDIIGVLNIRPYLNETLLEYGGHIGYSIRPTRRGYGYNLVNLYLGLEILQTFGVTTALLDATVTNIASIRTMEHFGGVRIREGIDPYDNTLTAVYSIDINNALTNNNNILTRRR